MRYFALTIAFALVFIAGSVIGAGAMYFIKTIATCYP